MKRSLSVLAILACAATSRFAFAEEGSPPAIAPPAPSTITGEAPAAETVESIPDAASSGKRSKKKAVIDLLRESYPKAAKAYDECSSSGTSEVEVEFSRITSQDGTPYIALMVCNKLFLIKSDDRDLPQKLLDGILRPFR